MVLQANGKLFSDFSAARGSSASLSFARRAVSDDFVSVVAAVSSNTSAAPPPDPPTPANSKKGKKKKTQSPMALLSPSSSQSALTPKFYLLGRTGSSLPVFVVSPWDPLGVYDSLTSLSNYLIAIRCLNRLQVLDERPAWAAFVSART